MTKTFITMMRERALGASSAALLIAMSAGVAHSAPLEPEACAVLNAERSGLVGQGVEAEMTKGAAWARQNLSQDRLFQIKRLIEVNEQLSFRCGIMVTERPSLLQRTPPPIQASTTPAGEDGQAPPKKPTKSKPKPAAEVAPAGVPGAKPKAAAKGQAVKDAGKETGQVVSKPVAEVKATQPVLSTQKPKPVEKAGN